MNNSIGQIEFYIDFPKILLIWQVIRDGESVLQLVQCHKCSQMESFIIVLSFLLQNFTVLIMVGNRGNFIDFSRFINSALTVPFPEMPRFSFVFSAELRKSLTD